MTTAEYVGLDDQLDEPVLRQAAPVTAKELYYRWEKQQWAVAEVGVERDREIWQGMRPFVRQEVLNALAELEVGEVCVTETLSSLMDFAPEADDRLYLCTQIADEARHVRFFQTYLLANTGQEELVDGLAAGVPTSYAEHFEPVLRAVTGAVRERGGDPVAWHEALIYYHLATEGVLATTVMRNVRQLARTMGMDALDVGLTNVTRDESRHVTFGLFAARRGVHNGYRDVIKETYLRATALAARVMVGPERRNQAPVIRQFLVARAAQLQAQWDMSRDRMLRQLAYIGLDEHRAEAEQSWQQACHDALDEYRERWGADHPVRRANLLAATA
jgi:ribonucleoside-diphosphate reductase beta chain